MPQQVGKQCSRCQGSMLPERDFHGEFMTCLQCGRSIDMVDGQPAQPDTSRVGHGARTRRRMPWE